MFFCCPQQVGGVAPTAHPQILRNPGQTPPHLRPQPAGQLHAAPVPFAPPRQFAFRPSQALELLRDHPPGCLLAALKTVPPVMIAPSPVRRGRQRLPPKFLAPQTPAAPNLLAASGSRRSSICRANSLRPAALSLGIPFSPGSRFTRSQNGRSLGALTYTSKWLRIRQ